MRKTRIAQVEDNSIIEETEYTEETEEESPILVAQRYLNIFHQIHIFNTAKKDEFEKSLLEMPEKVKEILQTIPGGRVLLEHMQEVYEKEGISANLLGNAANEKTGASSSVSQLPTTGIAGEISLGQNFASNLAESLATAFKNNNITPAGNGNLNELSRVLGETFRAYANNMQNVLMQNMQNLNKTQLQMQEQISSQLKNISVSAVTPTSEAASPSLAASQANVQNNNANSTTINNINVDSSCLKDLTDTIKSSDTQRHEDFLKIIEVLNKNFAQTPHSATELPTVAITAAVTEALKENSKQQLEAIKSFGETLAKTLMDSQQELAKTLAKSTPQPQTVYVSAPQAGDIVTVKAAEPTQPEKNNFIKNVSEKISETTNKLTQNFSQEKEKNQDSFMSKINKGISEKIDGIKEEFANKNNTQKKNNDNNGKQKNEQKNAQKQQQQQQQEKKINQKQTPPKKEEENQKKNSAKQQPQPQQSKATSATKAEDINLEKAAENEALKDIFFTDTPSEKSTDTFLDDIALETAFNDTDFTPPSATQDTDDDILADTFSDLPTTENQSDELADAFSDLPVSQEEAADDILSEAFMPVPETTKAPQSQPENKKEPQPEQKPQPQPQSKPENKKEPQPEPAPKPKKRSHLYDDAMQKIRAALHSEDTVSLNDLNVQKISLNDDDIMEQTEQQNDDVILDDESFDKYFPLETTQDEDEWDYVDENGNPVSPDEEGEWEYVDEDGNPISADEEGEWEYVDEDGNPVSPDEEGEWEYVDEYGNPISADETKTDMNEPKQNDGDDWNLIEQELAANDGSDNQ